MKKVCILLVVYIVVLMTYGHKNIKIGNKPENLIMKNFHTVKSYKSN